LEFRKELEKIPQWKRVYIDECGIKKCCVREHGRAARGVKVEDVVRGRKFQRINVVAAQIKNEDGECYHVASHCYTENTTGEFFENWFRKKLVKSVPRGYTIIMDNASFHRKKKLRNLARRHGLKLLFLPAYSPDYNPIEKTWANLKRALIDILPDTKNLQSGIYNYFNVEDY